MFNDIYDLVKSKLVVLLPGVNIIPRNRNMSAKNLNKTSNIEKMQNERVKSKSPVREKRSGSGIKKKVSFNFEWYSIIFILLFEFYVRKGKWEKIKQDRDLHSPKIGKLAPCFWYNFISKPQTECCRRASQWKSNSSSK